MTDDINVMARVMFLVRYRSRRMAKRELYEAGMRGTAEELNTILGMIERDPQRERIEQLANELGAAHVRAAFHTQANETPPDQGQGHDEWIVGEGASSGRTYLIYIGLDAAFIGEVFDSPADAPAELEKYDLDDGQVLGNILWLDSDGPPTRRERENLFELAREKLREYDSYQEFDLERRERNEARP